MVYSVRSKGRDAHPERKGVAVPLGEEEPSTKSGPQEKCFMSEFFLKFNATSTQADLIPWPGLKPGQNPYCLPAEIAYLVSACNGAQVLSH